MIESKVINQHHDNEEEQFPIVDEQGNILGAISRGHAHDGCKILHPVVHLHVFNSRGELELYIINSLAKPRPELITKKMPLPNEKGVRRFRLWWYDADKDEGRYLDIDRFKDQNVALDFNRTEQTMWFTRRSRSVDTIQFDSFDLSVCGWRLENHL